VRHQPNAFWKYSLGIYRAPKVADACLTLQEDWGADVNLLLYCCWLGQAGRALDKRSLLKAITAVSRWQAEVIKPLRQARRALKKPPSGLPVEWAGHLRKRIGALELELEYLEQCLLTDAAQALPPAKRSQPPIAATIASLNRYLALLSVPTGQAEVQVAIILDACCRRH
jgi:uncharacterized protein (TIGR02444 family)